MYLSRWYRVPAGARRAARRQARRRPRLPQVPRRPRRRPHAVDHARHPHPRQRAARRACRDPDGFERAVPDAARARPLLRRRAAGADRRRAADDRPAQPDPALRRRRRRARPCSGSTPSATAHTCTNPLYGRGCSLALVQALLAGRRHRRPPRRPGRRGPSPYEAASVREIEPWYHSSVEMDIAGADPGIERGRHRAARPTRWRGCSWPPRPIPVIGRALTRMMNLLATPAELAADAEFTARVGARSSPTPSLPGAAAAGPTRAELLDALAASSRPAGAA